MNSHFSKHRPGRSFVRSFVWIVLSVLIMVVDVYASAGGGEASLQPVLPLAVDDSLVSAAVRIDPKNFPVAV